MDPKGWGPSAWIFLHSITLNYPEYPSAEDKKNIHGFFSNLGNILPCNSCKWNYKSHLEKYPLNNSVLNSKQNLVKWLIDIHNSVNIMNNKPTYSHDDAIKEIMSNYDKKTNLKIYFMYIGLIIFLIFCLLLISKI